MDELKVAEAAIGFTEAIRELIDVTLTSPEGTVFSWLGHRITKWDEDPNLSVKAKELEKQLNPEGYVFDDLRRHRNFLEDGRTPEIEADLWDIGSYAENLFLSLSWCEVEDGCLVGRLKVRGWPSGPIKMFDIERVEVAATRLRDTMIAQQTQHK